MPSVPQEGSSRKIGLTRRAASLRQTKTAQNSIELQGCGGQPVHSQHQQQSPLMSQITSAMAANLATTTGTLLPKKSNWEVIEHFNSGGAKNKGSVSSSLIAVGVTKCNLDDSVGSNFSGSTCNSPMVPRDGSQKLLGNGEFPRSSFLLSCSCAKFNNNIDN